MMSENFNDRLAKLLEVQIKDYGSLISCERLSAGASQETYRIVIRTKHGPKKMALRVADSSKSVVGMNSNMATEARLIQAAQTSGVPVPQIIYVLKDEDLLGDGFLMEWLEGETLGAKIAKSPNFASVRPLLARQCGEILAHIHSVDVETSGLSEVLNKSTPEELVHESWDKYKNLKTPQPMIDYTARWLLDNLPPLVNSGLVHNDFRNGNLMVDTNEGIIAVLDWELSSLGDPIRDLGWLCTNSWRFGKSELPVGGFGEINDLLEAYESVTGKAVDPGHLKFWIVFGSFWWSVGCLEMAQIYRDASEKSVERPAIGRRSSECQVDCVNLLIPGPIESDISEHQTSNLNLPRADELLASVRDFLRTEVMAETKGRVLFLSRVAANSLDIVIREFESSPGFRDKETKALQGILGQDGILENLRWDLANRLRDGSMQLDQIGLADYLRQSVVNQVTIDQPNYSGCVAALNQPAISH
jgi:aminoglycoside phosphotransferase (APT) family kinase protein